MAHLGKGINAFQLKLIALFFMTVDHLGAYQTFGIDRTFNDLLRIFGRIAAPLFLFLIVEGLRHTRSKPKYFLRLYLGGVVIGFGNLLFQELLAQGYLVSLGNILPTFAYVVLYVMLIEKLLAAARAKQGGQAALAVLGLLATLLPVYFSWLGLNSLIPYPHYTFLSIVLPSPFLVEYSFLFVLLGVAWYFLRERKWICLLFAAFSLASLLIPIRWFFQGASTIFGPLYFSAYALFYPQQWYMILALPLMLLYNGEKGASCKYLFYVYYPLHQYLLLFLQLYVLR